MSFCQKCGKPLEADGQFCQFCGTRVDNNKKEAVAAKEENKKIGISFISRMGRKPYFFSVIRTILIYIIGFVLIKYAVFGGILGYFWQKLNLSNSTMSNLQLVVIIVLYASLIFITVVPLMLASIKRIHDLGASGYWSLLLLIPFINLLTIIILLLRKGAAVPNKYG
jgi:uncharacterized membrane protein YhaH (DUF805 family)